MLLFYTLGWDSRDKSKEMEGRDYLFGVSHALSRQTKK